MLTRDEMFKATVVVLLTAIAIAFFIWALIAMLLGQTFADSVTLALIGIGFAIISK